MYPAALAREELGRNLYRAGDYAKAKDLLARLATVRPEVRKVLDRLKEKELPVVAIGKIEDIFCGRGITEALHTGSNAEGMQKTVEALERIPKGLIFTNLVDFDMVYGHRNDAAGYAAALREVDAWLPGLTGTLGTGDMLVITADHGCDPTTPGTDHTREEVPLLVYSKGLRSGVNLGRRGTFADLGATVAEVFGVKAPAGESFLALLN